MVRTATRHDDGPALFAQAPAELLIAGEWRTASDGGVVEVTDPATEAALGTVASATVDDAREAAAAAAGAWPAWAATRPRERADILQRAYSMMLDQRSWLAQLIVLENGKAHADAMAEVGYAAEFLRWNAEQAVRSPGVLRSAPAADNKIMVVSQPVGPSVLVTPWNYPAAMVTRKVAPALAAGCPVVLKPAEETPGTALALARILVDAGVPDGVVNVVPTARTPEVVAALLAHSHVRKLSFTGSTETGRLLLRQAADRVLNVSMELGGNAPFIVLGDADIDEAVAGAVIAKLRNGGAACTAANRFLVHESVVSDFTAKLAARLSAMRVGPGLEPGVEVGPLVTEKARRRVAATVQAALDHGGRAVCGGVPDTGRGYFYPPTVLAGVAQDSPVLATEIFGPVAPVVSFTDVRDALTLANDTEHGLTAYIYTGDYRRGLRLADELECGMVGLNRPVVSDPAAPFGGMKQSGIGREGGTIGITEFLETKYIAAAW